MRGSAPDGGAAVGRQEPPGGRVRGRRAGVAVALAMVAAGAAACSSSPPSSSAAPKGTAAAAAAVRGAPTATENAGSAALAVKVTSDERPKGASGDLGIGILGSFDFGSQDGQGTMSVSGLSGSSNPGALHLIFTAAGLYLGATGSFSSLGGGKPWVEVSADSLGSLFASGSVSGGGPLNGLSTALIGDPLTALGLLDTDALTASVVGHPTVGGQKTTEYTVTIDPTKAAEEASGAEQALFSSMGKAPFTVHVWLDRAGRLVEVVDQSSGPASSSGSSGSGGQITGITVLLSDFGAPATISVPPASEVASPGTSSGSS